MKRIIRITEPRVVDGRARRSGEIVPTSSHSNYRAEEQVSAAEVARREKRAAQQTKQLERQQYVDEHPPVAVIIAPAQV
ncbi:unnamed protein product, partial [marine sediment metagenome]